MYLVHKPDLPPKDGVYHGVSAVANLITRHERMDGRMDGLGTDPPKWEISPLWLYKHPVLQFLWFSEGGHTKGKIIITSLAPSLHEIKVRHIGKSG